MLHRLQRLQRLVTEELVTEAPREATQKDLLITK